MMDDINKTDKMFGVVMSDGKGQFCEVGTAVENVKQEIFRGENPTMGSFELIQLCNGF
jgi:hypothetical protein